MHITEKDLSQMDAIKRLNIVNSITGIKPANLIGTVDLSGTSNLAIFSSVVHLGSNPPLIGMVSRPEGEVRRDTINNIAETGVYTINHVHATKIINAHYTSAKFAEAISEFDVCEFEPHFVADFEAPFVKGSPVSIGLRHIQSIPIEVNGTILIIGEVKHILIEDNLLSNEGYIDLDLAESAGISGLNSYYTFQKEEDLPYARVEQVPNLSLPRVTVEMYTSNPQRYELRPGDSPDAPICPYGNQYEWIGYDKASQSYVRFTRNLLRRLIKLP